MLLCLLALSLTCVAETTTFEALADSDILTTQYTGLTFSNAVVLSAGISLNEFDFPPRSGGNVLSDNGGPISISFNNPVLSVGGYFTYLHPLTLRIFDSGNNLLGSVSSSFSTNVALSADLGSAPNEFLQLSANDITRVTITGDPLGGSFTLDDLSYTALTSSIPEPSTSAFLITGIAWVIAINKRPKRR